MASVALRSVAKAYPGGVQAVDALDFEVRDGEFLVLLGPSGCGKSTTLRLIAGLEKATEGEILIGDQVVNLVPPKDRNTAMVFQSYALYPHLTVYRNMAFGLQLRFGGGWLARWWRRITRPTEAAEMAARRRGIRNQVETTARLLGIESLLDRMPGQLSGGERQRVALGRAMVRQPAVFLFDEPLSNLDAQLRLQLRRELKRLHGQLQTTMIYVTHDQTEALSLGDRIVVLRDGRLQQIGTPDEVYERPTNRFVAEFVGSPPMNFFEGRLEEGQGSLFFESDAVRQRLPEGLQRRLTDQGVVGKSDRRVLLGVRPADVEVQATPQEGSAARGRVIYTEPQGSEEFAVVAAASRDGSKNETKAELCCRTARHAVRVDDQVHVGFDESRLHLFDPETGTNLVAGGDETEGTSDETATMRSQP